MAPTTTLITFRIRAPSSTRTLKLYGSWDNFARGYPMSKDLQSGSEYWSGCFNFSNIICDGRPGDHMRARDGGLRMGGTYWYYYKLDDEVDFHNVCERATTNCPMMPGQLINVLHVPYAFSGNRSRNPSTSSTSSERRTMDPDDRFINPRPAPAKPEIMRVSTSPTFNDVSDIDNSSNTATPIHATPTSKPPIRLPRKASLESFTTQSSSVALAGGLRAAFRIRTARSQSPEAKTDGDIRSHRRAASVERSSHPKNASTDQAERGLLLRSTSDDSVPTLSFEQHRHQRLHAREPLGLRRGLFTEQSRQVEPLTLLKSNHQPLSTLEEVASSSNTPVDTSTSERIPAKSEPDLEKRLPYLAKYTFICLSAEPYGGFALRKNLDLEQLESHFSATTIDTEYQPISIVFPEKSHFSTWTVFTDTDSTIIDSSVALPKPHGGFYKREVQAESPTAEPLLPSSISISSISSSICTTPSTSFLDTDVEFEAAPLSARLHIPDSQKQHYQLPPDEYTSQVTLKGSSQEPLRGRTGNPAFVEYERSFNNKETEAQLVHSESMQKLLDELSYLSGMIQQ